MSKIDDRSSVGIGESMDLFTMPTVDVGVGKVRYIEYKPLNQLNQDVGLEFEIPNTGNRYIDLRRTYLMVKVRIKNGDGTDIPANEGGTTIANFGPVNNLLHSLFSQIDIYMQKQLVTSSNSNYPYEALFNTLFKYDEQSKTTHLQAQLWFKDTGTMDAKGPGVGNSGLTVRALYTEKSQTFEMMGPILSDVCWTNRYILNGVELKFRFWPTHPNFHLMSAAATPHYKTEIVDASLSVCMVSPSPQTLVAHQEIMVKKKWAAVYPYLKTDVKKYSISKGSLLFQCR